MVGIARIIVILYLFGIPLSNVDNMISGAPWIAMNFDNKAKIEDLKIKGLFKHCDDLISHLTTQQRDQFRRYLTNEFKKQRDQRRSEVSFRNWYK